MSSKHRYRHQDHRLNRQDLDHRGSLDLETDPDHMEVHLTGLLPPQVHRVEWISQYLLKMDIHLLLRQLLQYRYRLAPEETEARTPLCCLSLRLHRHHQHLRHLL